MSDNIVRGCELANDKSVYIEFEYSYESQV